MIRVCRGLFGRDGSTVGNIGTFDTSRPCVRPMRKRHASSEMWLGLAASTCPYVMSGSGSGSGSGASGSGGAGGGC